MYQEALSTVKAVNGIYPAFYKEMKEENWPGVLAYVFKAKPKSLQEHLPDRNLPEIPQGCNG